MTPRDATYSWAAEKDPGKVRALLLQDPYNVPLRRHYLALRTPELLDEDRGSLRTYRDTLKVILPGLIGGAILGLIVWAISLGVVAIGWNPGQGRAAQVVGILRMFATTFGLAVSVIAFSLTTGLFSWSCALKGRTLGQLAAELGPLPEDSPDNLAEARARFLPR